MTIEADKNKKAPWFKHEPYWYFSYYKFKMKQQLKGLVLKDVLALVVFCLLGYFAYKVEFFVVFLIVAALYLLYRFGLDHGKSQGGGGGIRSAYSVFNENCQSIPGTFSARDIDRNLRRGGGVM